MLGCARCGQQEARESLAKTSKINSIKYFLSFPNEWRQGDTFATSLKSLSLPPEKQKEIKQTSECQ